MRLQLPAVEIVQDKEMKLYLTKLTAGQIRELIDSKQLVPDTYNPDIRLESGYQRTLDKNRMRKILNFLREQV